jgi:hypothetical protein
MSVRKEPEGGEGSGQRQLTNATALRRGSLRWFLRGGLSVPYRCPGLVPGRFTFLLWQASSEREAPRHKAVAFLSG